MCLPEEDASVPLFASAANGTSLVVQTGSEAVFSCKMNRQTREGETVSESKRDTFLRKILPKTFHQTLFWNLGITD